MRDSLLLSRSAGRYNNRNALSSSTSSTDTPFHVFAPRQQAYDPLHISQRLGSRYTIQAMALSFNIRNQLGTPSETLFGLALGLWSHKNNARSLHPFFATTEAYALSNQCLPQDDELLPAHSSALACLKFMSAFTYPPLHST